MKPITYGGLTTIDDALDLLERLYEDDLRAQLTALLLEGDVDDLVLESFDDVRPNMDAWRAAKRTELERVAANAARQRPGSGWTDLLVREL